MLVAGDFSAILRIIDQTFFIEVPTVDFGDVCFPGVPFTRFNHTPGLGPDDSCSFQKAVDTVSHPKLLSEIKAYNISDDVLEWIRFFCTIAPRRSKLKIQFHILI